MRQRCAKSEQAWFALPVRRCLFMVLASWLVIASFPFAAGNVLAAPPEVERVDWSSAAAEDSATAPERSLDADRRDDDMTQRFMSRDGVSPGSVRPRGLEAPVQLRQEAAAAEAKSEEPPDPGDGDPQRSRARGGSGKTAERPKRESKPSRGLRVWPMRADSYSFSQAFGCVPQIAHFYQPGDGCPAEAPVIHHGIDMAAPEGTPFYAAASGWVTESGYDREVGVANTRIIIQHEGRNDSYATEYLHWIASFVEVGDYVEAGEFIGEVGSVGYSTGPHLHFSVIDLDTGGNVDPVAWLPDEAGNEGYRGRQPRERAAMRLPAGTTAGVPEYTDPTPPAPPARDDLRAAGIDNQGRSREDRQRKRDRKDRQDKKERKKATRDANAASNGDGNATDESDAREGKSTERTRTRERTKDGESTIRNARGENSGREKRNREERDATRESDKSDRADKRSGDESSDTSNDADGGKKSGKKHDNRSASNGDAVNQRETKSGKKNGKKN